MLGHFRGTQPDYFCGWYYLFSPAFRLKVHEKWGGNVWMKSACVCGGVLGMVITTAVAIFILVAAWELLEQLMLN